MSAPYIGEIRMFGGNFAPAGWAFCNGQLMPISQNDTLFNLIGTTYGGDGQETFGMPQLQGRIPIHAGTVSGTTFQLAEQAGTETVTLTTNQIPIHNHAFLASGDLGTSTNPTGNLLAQSSALTMYRIPPASAGLAANSNTPIGGNQPHENLMPFLCVSFIISMFGIFPSQT